MSVPWGMIYAEERATENAKKLEDLQGKVDEALTLLKMDKPDIKRVIRTLGRKGAKPS